MNWDKGIEAHYYATLVHPITWADIGRFEITGGKIDHSQSDLIESATIECKRYQTIVDELTEPFPDNHSLEQYVRIHFDARQNGEGEHIAMFTGLATAPVRDINGTITRNSLDCYSVLKPAQDIYLPRGWYAPAEANSADLMKRLLEVIPAPVDIEAGAPTLDEAIVSERNETYLSMFMRIVNAIGWRVKIDGYGVVHVCPKADPTEPVVAFDSMNNDSIEPELSITEDWFGCPNVFMATWGDLVAIVKDESPDSILSTVNRGREIWMSEEISALSNDETLAEYAARRLKEEQSVAFEISYDRRYHPDVYLSDIVSLNYPAQDIVGNFIVTSQSIELGYGARTSEEVRRVESEI